MGTVVYIGRFGSRLTLQWSMDIWGQLGDTPFHSLVSFRLCSSILIGQYSLIGVPKFSHLRLRHTSTFHPWAGLVLIYMNILKIINHNILYNWIFFYILNHIVIYAMWQFLIKSYTQFKYIGLLQINLVCVISIFQTSLYLRTEINLYIYIYIYIYVYIPRVFPVWFLNRIYFW